MKRVSQEKIEAIANSLCEGVSQREAARLHGMSSATIHKIYTHLRQTKHYGEFRLEKEIPKTARKTPASYRKYDEKLSAYIMDAIVEVGKPMKAKEISAYLISKGYPIHGPSVHSCLSKMYIDGILTRHDHLYDIPPKD